MIANRGGAGAATETGGLTPEIVLLNDTKPRAMTARGFAFTGRYSPYWFSFAFSHSAVKAAASLMASSESILRLISMPAFFRPFISLE